MYQVIVFFKDSVDDTEKQANDWLKKNSGKIEVLSLQSELGSGSMAISILYRLK